MGNMNSPAGSRILSLLDANSFIEIGGRVTARSTDFNLDAEKAESDGVITGYGTVEGNLVYVYSQDASVLNGTIGEMHAKKIVSLYSMARKMGAPIVGMIDCGGIRLQESTDALSALGSIYRSMAMASGVIPQIVAVFGNCGGGLSLLPALADFSYLSNEKGCLFVNAKNTLPENADGPSNDSAEFQAKTGHVDFTGTEAEIFAGLRALLSMLPANNEDEGEILACNDDLNRSVGALDTLGAADALAQIADNGLFTETKKDYGTDIKTGFLRLGGSTVGALASGGGELSGHAIEKAASFVRFCDAFNIPILSLVNTTGVEKTWCAERLFAPSAAKLIFAYTSATVPKVSVVCGKAYGTAYTVFGSKAVGADLVYAYPEAEIGMMSPDLAAKILYDGKDAETMKKGAESFKELQQNVNSAASRGYVDTIIEPADTRKYVIGAFEMLYTKRESRPERRHGTI